MRALFCILAAVISGCVSSRPPGTLTPPATLQHLNAVLNGTRATLYDTTGHEQRDVFLSIGPERTLVKRSATDRGYAIPTDLIAFVEIDDSQSTVQGAVAGAKSGAMPGLVAMGAGAVVLATCEGWGCLGAFFLGAGGALASGVGAGIGAATGAAITSRRYPVVVYEAPVSRYPDVPSRAAPLH